MRFRTKIELSGIVFIALLGAALHFAYAWSGDRWWMAIVAAVDESVWEHLKLAFWPALLFSLLVWPVYGRTTPNFWVARATALLTMPAAIAVGFYGYTAILGHHVLLYDIMLFVGSIAAGQMAALGLYAVPELGRPIRRVAIMVILLQAATFGTLTFLNLPFPPFLAR